MTTKVKRYLFPSLMALMMMSAISCDNGSSPFEQVNDFDQGPFLQNLGENFIVPAYETLSEETEALAGIIDQDLGQDFSTANLERVRVQLKRARIAWQACSFYNFGPASSNGLGAALNIYPIDENQVELIFVALTNKPPH